MFRRRVYLPSGKKVEVWRISRFGRFLITIYLDGRQIAFDYGHEGILKFLTPEELEEVHLKILEMTLEGEEGRGYDG